MFCDSAVVDPGLILGITIVSRSLFVLGGQSPEAAPTAWLASRGRSVILLYDSHVCTTVCSLWKYSAIHMWMEHATQNDTAHVLYVCLDPIIYMEVLVLLVRLRRTRSINVFEDNQGGGIVCFFSVSYFFVRFHERDVASCPIL